MTEAKDFVREEVWHIWRVMAKNVPTTVVTGAGLKG